MDKDKSLTTIEEASSKSDSGWQIYRRLLGYSGRHWPLFILCVLGFAAFGGAQAGFAHTIKLFLDSVESADLDAAYDIPLLIIIIALIRGLGYFFGTYSLARISFYVVNDLRKELFDHLLLLPGKVHDRFNSGELVSMIIYNVTQVSNAASQAIKVIIREGLTVAALLGYLFWQDWQLTLVFLLIAPVLGGLVSVASRHFRRLGTKMQVSMGKVTHVANESIQGYRIVRSYGGERYEQRRFHAASDDNTRQSIKFSFVDALQTPIMAMIVAVALAAVMAALLYRSAMTPGVTAGDLVAFIGAAGLIAKPVRSLTQVNAIIQQGIAAANSIFEMLDLPPETNNGHEKLDRVEGRIEFKDVSFGYQPDQPVLKNINLAIEPGETVALVGRSGSGKTTLVSLLSRFYELDSGEIRVDGIPLGDIEIASLRQQIALVNQQVVLFNDTVARNIAYGQLTDQERTAIERAATDANALDFIRQLPDGFDTIVGEDGTRLSGGQRQRLSIARALLKDAPILVLDEATSALDTESERAIQSALLAVMEGRTTMVIAHRLSTIENADRIVVMDQGCIVEQGSHRELMALNGLYSHLHSRHFEN